MRKNEFVHNPDGTTCVHLTQGQVCLLDTEDWESLKHLSWHALKSPTQANTFYVGSQSGGIKLKMHREIMRPPAGLMVDHINHNPLDNRRCNLRVCNAKENQFNVKKKALTLTGFKGVHFFRRTGRFYAQICLDGKNKHLGYFKTAVEAAKAYDEAAVNHFGEFACLNLQ